MILTGDRAAADHLARAKVVAVLGAQLDAQLPAHYVPDYLYRQGYRIVPVNPTHLGETRWGEPFRAHLGDIAEPVDLVDVFRRAEHLDGHLADFLAMRPAPGAVWFQLGIRNDRVAAALAATGIDVIQDRCTMADHRRFRQAGLLP